MLFYKVLVKRYDLPRITGIILSDKFQRRPGHSPAFINIFEGRFHSLDVGTAKRSGWAAEIEHAADRDFGFVLYDDSAFILLPHYNLAIRSKRYGRGQGKDNDRK